MLINRINIFALATFLLLATEAYGFISFNNITGPLCDDKGECIPPTVIDTDAICSPDGSVPCKNNDGRIIFNNFDQSARLENRE